jgi:hypothetical protein
MNLEYLIREYNANEKRLNYYYMVLRNIKRKCSYLKFTNFEGGQEETMPLTDMDLEPLLKSLIEESEKNKIKILNNFPKNSTLKNTP